MATKFSQFTTGIAPVDATTFLVGYESVANTNNQYSKTDIVGWLTSGSGAISTLYTADGTIGTTRKALITDTIQFRDSGDTSDIFTLNTNGAFALGLGTTPGGVGAVIIGQDSVANQRGVSIGRSVTSGIEGVCIGYEAGLSAATGRNINIGTYAQGSGTASIMLRTAPGFASTNTTPYSFSVYMTSTATPDFEVIGGGESTLNTSLKITGQGYTELHTGPTDMTFSWNDSNVQSTTMGASTPTFVPTNPKAGATYILTLIQTGAVTVNWNSLVKWPGGTAPTLSGSGKTDVVTLICYDAAANSGAGAYYGSATLDLA